MLAVPNKAAHTILRRRAILFALLGVLTAVPAGGASAGLLDFFFGGGRAARPVPPPSLPSVVAPVMRALADPFDADRIREPRSERGPSVAYCVRLCDGHPFPVQNAGISPAQACRSFCPASQTEIFAGGSIDHAVSPGGKRYSDLPNAFLYRERVVDNCTCNGKTPGGLASIEVKDDPTLRPGDIVATNDGLVAYTGSKNKTAEFTPVQSYRGISAATRKKLSELEIRKIGTAEASDAALNAYASDGGGEKPAQSSR